MNWRVFSAAVFPATLAFWLLAADDDVRLARHRNLGKAFYENPTTAKEAVEEFRKALALSPNSTREQLNYALALLRAGSTDDAVRLLQEVQSREPSLPHTWFNLGIAWKKAGETEKALVQFQRLVQIAPDNAIVHYNRGALLRTAGQNKEAAEEFETAARLDHSLAAPHFQLFNLYRTTGRAEEARKALERFQALKKTQEGAAIPEDVEWTDFAEVYDPAPGPAGALARVNASFGPPAPLPAKLGITDASLQEDFNNDGLLDSVVLTPAEARIQLTGGTATHFSWKGSFHQALVLDYDHDYDQDLLLLGVHPALIRNAGAAGWQDRTADFPFAADCQPVSATILRVVADTKGFDVAMTCANRAGVLYRDLLLGKYRAESLAVPAGATGLASADLDNDGSLDLLFAKDNHVWQSRNSGRQFASPEKLAPVAGAAFVALDADLSGRIVVHSDADCPPVQTRDLTGDGLEDVVCRSPNGLRMRRNLTPVAGRNWIGVQLEGVRSAKLAVGSEVEVKAGNLYQKRTYSGAPLAFSLGTAKVADTVRITWPNGLIQNETNQPGGKVHAYKEAQRLSGSCPLVWTWDGTSFRYITDILGVAPLGASSGDGTTFPVDSDEYIQIPRGALREANGLLQVRLTEELSEVAYLDQVRLLAVDTPDIVQLLTNEKFKSPPFPEFRLFTVRDSVPPAHATDDRGRDVLDRVLHSDNSYTDGFHRDMKGRAATHSLTLSFGDALHRLERPILALDGWVDWADGSTFLGWSQEDGAARFVPPRLEARGDDGIWRTIIEDMGMPAGKPKVIAVDLAGKLPRNVRELRIVTSLCIYWDRIRLVENANIRPTTTPLALNSAELRFRGFSPNRVHPERKQPEQFAWEPALPSSMWNPTPGMYTRFGDVRELLDGADDKLVVMGSGDELILTFRAAPPPRPGYHRQYVFGVAGWAKDRDANTVHGQTVLPLPWRGMKTYGVPQPDTPGNRDWQKRYLTRPALRPMQPLISRRLPRSPAPE